MRRGFGGGAVGPILLLQKIYNMPEQLTFSFMRAETRYNMLCYVVRVYIKKQEDETMNAKLSVEIISDRHGVITVAIGLMGKLISVVAGTADDVFDELTRLFEGVKVLSK